MHTSQIQAPRIGAVLVLCATLWLTGCASTPPATPNAPNAGTASNAQPMTRDSVRAQFAKMANDRAALDKLVAARFPQLTGRKQALMTDQVAATFASPAFADRTYDLLAPKLQGQRPMAPGAQVAFQAAIRDQGAALGMRLTLRGMTRLGADDQERFARHAIALHRSVDASTCRAMIDGKLGATRLQEIEQNFGASLSDAEFEQSLALSRRAMQAELAGQPPVPQLTTAQSEAASLAWGRAILKRSAAPPAANKARFANYAADRAKASDADMCWVNLQYLEAMFDLRGQERAWQLQSYMVDTASDE
jgi:hypothetical protein